MKVRIDWIIKFYIFTRKQDTHYYHVRESKVKQFNDTYLKTKNNAQDHIFKVYTKKQENDSLLNLLPRK